MSAVACLLIGYPMALAIARSAAARRPILLLLVMLPFWTGFLLRIAAWIGLLRDDGWINAALLALGVVHAPVPLLHTDFAMYVGIVYAYLPFMVLPLEARLARADPMLERAAADLGAGPVRRFLTVTLPLSLPGVAAGLVLVFVPVAGRIRHPRDARRSRLADHGAGDLAGVLRQSRLAAGGGPVAGAAGAAAGCRRWRCGGCDEPVPAAAWLLGAYAFLYVPIVLLVATSFNDSRLTTVWTGFSLRWYAALLADDAADRGGAAVAAHRRGVGHDGHGAGRAGRGWRWRGCGRFRGRGLFAGLLAAPLVLPDLLIGLALLLLFVAVQTAFGGPDARRADGDARACHRRRWPIVAVVVEARLHDAGTALEEAAMDLGASPLLAFLHVTLPLAAPALASGWLLAFTLSLDDVVIASFVSGPGATTLPMVVFSTLRLGATPELNALATVVLGVVAAALLVAWAVSGRARQLAGGGRSVLTGGRRHARRRPAPAPPRPGAAAGRARRARSRPPPRRRPASPGRPPASPPG